MDKSKNVLKKNTGHKRGHIAWCNLHEVLELVKRIYWDKEQKWFFFFSVNFKGTVENFLEGISMLCILTGLVLYGVFTCQNSNNHILKICAFHYRYIIPQKLSSLPTGKKINILIVSECKHLHQCSETVFKLLIACVLFSVSPAQKTLKWKCLLSLTNPRP